MILDIVLNRDEFDDGYRLTDTIQFGGKLFFCRVDYEIEENFTVDVVMKGNQEECERFLIEASIVDPNSKQTVIRAIFPPRPMKGDNTPNICLTVPQARVASVFKYNVEFDQFSIQMKIKIIKQETLRLEERRRREAQAYRLYARP